MRIKRIFKLVGNFVPNYLKLCLKNFYILAIEYGQLKSMKSLESVDKSGNPIPWYTYPAIEFLSTIDFSDKKVFEYGGGNSTLWWAKRAKMVVTVEHSIDWYRKVEGKIGCYNNVKLYLKESKQEYVNSIFDHYDSDIIVIDGRWRGDCIKAIASLCVEKSKHDFIIILDNSDWYPFGKKYLQELLNLLVIDFHGFGPINGYTWTTSILFHRSFKLKFYDIYNYSKFAIKQTAEDDCSC